MEGLFYSNIAAGAATLFVLLLRRFFKNKIFSKVFVLLWAVIILRLLLPFEFSSAVSVYNLFEKEEEKPHFEVTVPNQTEEKPIYTDPKPSVYYPTLEVSYEEKPSFEEISFTVWIIGMGLSGTYFILRHFYTVRKIMSDADLITELPKGFGYIRVYENKNLRSPLSFGVFSPRIVIPKDVPKEQLPFVLIHEKTHIENRDAVLKMLSAAAVSINWFSPFAWIAAKYLCIDMEKRCDERVLFILGKEKAAFYANTILDFAERASLSISYFGAAPISERIVSIMKNKNRKRNLPAVLCIFLAVVLMITACGTLPEENEPAPEISSENEEKILYLDPVSGQPMCYEGDEIFETYSSMLGTMYSYLENNYVFASAEGTVLKAAENSEEFGNYVLIEHSDGNKTLYAFCGGIFVKEGQKVDAGDKIAEMHINTLSGETGNEQISKSVCFRFITGEIGEDTDIFIDVETGEMVAVNRSEEADSLESELSAKEIAKSIGYMTLEEITAAGYYPSWMQPNSYIIYDENGNPTIEKGGELIPEDLVGRPEFTGTGAFFTVVNTGDPFMKIYPNTKAEYDLHGFIQNIYYLWPDGSYNLSPYDMEAFMGTLMEFVWPCEEIVISAEKDAYKGHAGIDIGYNRGSEIYAAANGTVVVASYKNTGYGYHIIIDHGNGYQTCYAHCSELLVEVGAEVKAGDLIGKTGSTGNSTGNHLHFEIRLNGEYQNPTDYVTP